MTDQQPEGPGRAIRRRAAPGALAVLCILLALAVAATGCTKAQSTNSDTAPQARDAALRQIAVDYARTGDLAQAQAALDKLELANPAQLIVSLAESDVSAGRPAGDIEPLARFAEALGTRSPKLIAYLAPTAAPAPTIAPPTVPPSATPAPAFTPTASAPTASAPTETAPTETAAPPTATPTAAPQKPRIVADSDVNLRGGPGKTYPIVARLNAGQEAEILGRNASGDWWQVAWPDGKQAWVAGTVVRVLGPIDTIAVAKNIPAPPPTAPPAPRPTAAPAAPAAPPKPSTAFVVKNVRVKAVGEDSQSCQGGEHNLFVQVIDPAGNPIDGIRVREVFTGQVEVTGAQGKGPGRVQFDIYRDGGGQLEIVDEGGNPKSPQTRGMSANLPDWDLFQAAGYCDCKPYPDVDSCHAGWEARDFRYMPMSHYAYEVVFQRTS